MNTLEYFACLESDPLRSDIAEGADSALQVAQIEIQEPGGAFVPIGGVINPIFYRRRSVSGINILCLYAIQTPQGLPVDPRNFSFGEKFVVIRDGEQFLNRVRSAAAREHKKVCWGLVNYVEPSYNGPLGPFRKLSRFAYQSEFRFAITGTPGQPFILRVGDISDNCIVGGSHEINVELNRLRGGVSDFHCLLFSPGRSIVDCRC